jgi:hypothetical protein
MSSPATVMQCFPQQQSSLSETQGSETEAIGGGSDGILVRPMRGKFLSFKL